MLANMIRLKRTSPQSSWVHQICTCRYLAACTAAGLLLVLCVGVVQRTAVSEKLRLTEEYKSKNNNDDVIQIEDSGSIQHVDEGFVLESTEVPIAFWDQTRNRDIRLYVLPDNQTTIIQQPDFCPDDLFLLVFVSSAVTHFEHREVIRKTWASVNMTSSVKVLFMLGDPRDSTLQELVEEESKRYGDVIQEDFVDSYRNLTLKVTMMLKWIEWHCSQISYLLKTDDDIFVDLEGLVSLLQTENRTRILMGWLFCNEGPYRNPIRKAYCPRYLFNGTRYPYFLDGPGYVMSADVIRGLYRAALDTPFFHLDDVFFTGFLPRSIGVVPQDHTAFISFLINFHPLLFCRHSVVLKILQSSLKAVEDMWNFYKTTKLYCSELEEHKHLLPRDIWPSPRPRSVCP